MGKNVASTVKPTGAGSSAGGASGMRKKGSARSPKRSIQKGNRFFFFCEKIFLPCFSLGMEEIIVDILSTDYVA